MLDFRLLSYKYRDSKFNVVLCVLTMGLTLIACKANAQDSLLNKCGEIDAAALRAEANLCAGHEQCKGIVNKLPSCESAVGFLQRLKKSVGDGKETFFGKKKVITARVLFDACLTERAKEIENIPEMKSVFEWIEKNSKESGDRESPRKMLKYFEHYEFGKLIDSEMPNGCGYEIDFMEKIIGRFCYSGGKYSHLDHCYFNVPVRLSVAYKVTATGQAAERIVFLDNDGDKYFYGESVDGDLFKGKKVEFPNTILSEGLWMVSGSLTGADLHIGKIYKKDGSVVEYDAPKQKRLEEEAQKLTMAKKQREAAEAKALEDERRIAEKKRIEAQYLADLDSLNAGELFTKWSDLMAAGEKEKASLAAKKMLSKFPNHALTASVAQNIEKNITTQSMGDSKNKNGNVGPSVAPSTNQASPDILALFRRYGAADLPYIAPPRGECAAADSQLDSVLRKYLSVPNRGSVDGFNRVMYFIAITVSHYVLNCSDDSSKLNLIPSMVSSYKQAKHNCDGVGSSVECGPKVPF